MKAIPAQKTVSVSISGPPQGRAKLLGIIRSDFDTIHLDLPSLKAEASIPLPQDPSVSISYEELQAYSRAGNPSLTRLVRGEIVVIDVDALLASVELPKPGISRPVSVFVSYAHKDDSFRAELDTRLKLLQRYDLIDGWHDLRIVAGAEWKQEIDQRLDDSELILLLVSPDFLASDYCYDVEMKRALERHEAGHVRVLPIIIRDCDWSGAPFSRLQVLPLRGKPVRRWRDRDSAWKSVAAGIKDAAYSIRAARAHRR